MPDYTVQSRGTDTSGRTIYGTAYMWQVWDQILADPAVAPFASKVTIVQGAFMARNGGGAAASAGYHDQAGCLDVRTWNLTGGEMEAFIRAARRHGFAFWRRDRQHGGMDPHAHGVLGTDSPLASGAAYQWRQYLAGRDGLASNGPDYEWRPSPLVTTPPPEDDMFSDDDRKTLQQIAKTQAAEKAARLRQSQRIMTAIRAARKASKDKAILDQLDVIEAALTEGD